MSAAPMTRRGFLASAIGVALAGPLLGACGAPAAPATAVPAPTQASAPAPTQAPAATAAPSGEKIPLSVATYAGYIGDYERDFAKRWAEQHPEVNLTVDAVPYGEMAKKQLLQIAAGDMEDISFSGIKWYPYTIYKGGFRAIDDYVKSRDPGMDDFLESCLVNSKFEGKLYGLPYQIDNGNLAIVIFNVDLLSAKGVKVPTDDWTVKDFVDLAVKMTDKDKKIFGASYLPGTFYDFASLARTWGTDIFSPDAKQLLFNTDPKSVEAARWLTDLRGKYHAAPNRDESQGLSFAAGKLASTNDSISGIQAATKEVGDKFKWDIALFPKGPAGLRGYHTFTEDFSIYTKSKQPEKAYDLIVFLTSKEAGIARATQSAADPGPRKSVWAEPQVLKMNPSYERVFKWISSVPGPFPIPYNLRYSELQDKWGNVSLPLFYGEVPFNEGMKKVQEACQAIMDLPRG